MEALAAVALVGNVVQFVELATKLTSKTVEIYRSQDGTPVDNTDLEFLTKDLIDLNDRLKKSSSANTPPEIAALCAACNVVAAELLAGLMKLKMSSGRKNKVKAVGLALRSLWSTEEMAGIERRLDRFRVELNLHVAVELR